MAYTYRLSDSIDRLELSDLEKLRSQAKPSPFADPRFLAAVEISMGEVNQFKYVLLYDRNRPVAFATLTIMTIDLADFADDGVLKRIIQHTPTALSRLRYLRMVVCGLPISTGHSPLVFAPECDRPQVFVTLDGIIREAAAAAKANAVVYKEFEKDDLSWTSSLLDLGYQRSSTPPAYFLQAKFRNLDDYCRALRSHYRKQVKRSLRKRADAGLEVAVLADASEILRSYTSEVHGLYHQMREKAQVKYETLSIDFLHELARRMSGPIQLIVLTHASKIVAFGWCLQGPDSYHMMYAGLDFALNEKMDLYFNLHYAALDCALRSGVSRIEFGVTADAFKARLGCYAEPLHFFTKGIGPLMSLMVRYGSKFMLSREPAIPSFDVFKAPGEDDDLSSKPRKRVSSATI
jgi:predicted N-acyltransferase